MRSSFFAHDRASRTSRTPSPSPPRSSLQLSLQPSSVLPPAFSPDPSVLPPALSPAPPPGSRSPAVPLRLGCTPDLRCPTRPTRPTCPTRPIRQRDLSDNIAHQETPLAGALSLGIGHPQSGDRCAAPHLTPTTPCGSPIIHSLSATPRGRGIYVYAYTSVFGTSCLDRCLWNGHPSDAAYH